MIELVHHGAWDIAAVVFVASVVIPTTKFVVILYLVYSIRYHARLAVHARIHLYEIVEFIGRWSMIDVFVVAILTALVQLGFLASINPGSAAVFFALSVAFTMLSAQALDPRLIWDSAEAETAAACLRPILRLPAVETPKEESSRRISAVWLVPLLALIIALVVAWRTYADRGPLIEIVFDNAAGIEAGQTTLRFRDVNVGTGRAHRPDARPEAGRRHRPHPQGRGAVSRRRRPSSGWCARASPPRASPASRP